MCGIILTNKEIQKLDLNFILQFLKNRGPDATSIKIIQEITFIHTLLSMTGPVTEQPFISDDQKVICMFNGEIYNFEEFGNYKTDGECLIPLYQIYGSDFISKLDGEFAIVLVDFNKNELIVSTDIFSTKPLWIGLDENFFGVSTYSSCLERLGFNNFFQILANKTYILDLETLQLKEEKVVHEFDLRQFKTDFNDWNKAFTNSILKRVKHAKTDIFIGMSGGYDSGAIACELTKQNIPFTAYSISNVEDKNVMINRSKIVKNSLIFDIKRDEFLLARNYLKENCEEYKLNIDNGEKERYFDLIKSRPNEAKKLIETIEFRKNGQLLTDDNGAIGCSYICSLAIKNNQKIYISGSGADEIFSDYGFNGVKFYNHSSIGGYFPDDLKKVFPWKNFFGNTQRAYLMKEEHTTGSYGIEGRYPFLDKYVVQEFLWLSNNLKNKNYKSPLYNYLKTNNFPFEENQKVGFGCGHSGPSNFNKSYETLSEETIKKTREKKVTDLIISQKVNFNNYLIKTFENHDFLKKENIVHICGYMYHCKIDINDFGMKYSLSNNFKLYENNTEIGNQISSLEKIIKYGGGLFCFYTSKSLFFSTSDNSSPILNEKLYSINK